MSAEALVISLLVIAANRQPLMRNERGSMAFAANQLRACAFGARLAFLGQVKAERPDVWIGLGEETCS